MTLHMLVIILGHATPPSELKMLHITSHVGHHCGTSMRTDLQDHSLGINSEDDDSGLGLAPVAGIACRAEFTGGLVAGCGWAVACCSWAALPSDGGEQPLRADAPAPTFGPGARGENYSAVGCGR
jgi:hypothetical protein